MSVLARWGTAFVAMVPLGCLVATGGDRSTLAYGASDRLWFMQTSIGATLFTSYSNRGSLRGPSGLPAELFELVGQGTNCEFYI
jgi:hypothetical protein